MQRDPSHRAVSCQKCSEWKQYETSPFSPAAPQVATGSGSSSSTARGRPTELMSRTGPTQVYSLH